MYNILQTLKRSTTKPKVLTGFNSSLTVVETTVPELLPMSKQHLSETKTEMLTSGSLNFMFTRKAVLTFYKTEEMDIEELELELIDAGLEEIAETMEPQDPGYDKAIIKIFGEFEAFGDLSKALEEMNIEVKSAKHERIANTPIDLTDEQMEELDVLIDKLEDDEDVQAVYTNIN